MSPTKANILKLLTLCALAHSISALSLSTAKEQPTTVSTLASSSGNLHDVHKYLIVRGEQASDAADIDNEDFNAAANILLQAHDAAAIVSNKQPHDVDTALPDDYMEQCEQPSHKVAFSAYDYTVLLSMLVISLGIGVFYGFFKQSGGSSNEFLLGSEMSIFPVTLSLTTSFITAIELLGNPSEMYFQGTQFVLIGKLLHWLHIRWVIFHFYVFYYFLLFI